MMFAMEWQSPEFVATIRIHSGFGRPKNGLLRCGSGNGKQSEKDYLVVRNQKTMLVLMDMVVDCAKCCIKHKRLVSI